MINLIFIVSNKQAVNNLHETLENVVPDIETANIVFCVASDELAEEIKKIANKVFDDWEGSLAGLVFVRFGNDDPFYIAKEYVVPNGWVFLWNGLEPTPIGIVPKMLAFKNTNPRAGLIVWKGGLKAENIYDKVPLLEPTDQHEIDTASLVGVLVKSVNYLDFYKNNTDFGLTLRRKGFTNYNIKTNKDTKNGENDNLERFASKRQNLLGERENQEKR